MTKKKKVKTINLFNLKNAIFRNKNAVMAKERDKVVIFLSASFCHTCGFYFSF
jgi:hypothetical protein